MSNRSHTEFILSPILDILKETVTACAGIGNNMETQSLSEYVLQTTFLKMTGASEQKLKCICWEMATYDYDYRYKYLNNSYGECSAYNDKQKVYIAIIKNIQKLDNSFSISSLYEDIEILGRDSWNITNTIEQKKKGLSQKVYKEIESTLNDSPLVIWKQHDYEFYKSNWEKVLFLDFATQNSLLHDTFQNYFTSIVYKHRNRCAHNLKSYQNNIPTLTSLLDTNYDYENYFFRFAILILLDEIFMRLFKKYLSSIDSIL